MGYAALLPRFRKAGLRLVDEISGFAEIGIEGRPFEKGLDSFEIAAEFFGIERGAAVILFGGPTVDWREGQSICAVLDGHDPAVAAGRIERFCRDNGIDPPCGEGSP